VKGRRLKVGPRRSPLKLQAEEHRELQNCIQPATTAAAVAWLGNDGGSSGVAWELQWWWWGTALEQEQARSGSWSLPWAGSAAIPYSTLEATLPHATQVRQPGQHQKQSASSREADPPAVLLAPLGGRQVRPVLLPALLSHGCPSVLLPLLLPWLLLSVFFYPAAAAALPRQAGPAEPPGLAAAVAAASCQWVLGAAPGRGRFS